MKTKDIAELLGIDEAEVLLVLEEDVVISSIKTPEQACDLYHSCSNDMDPAIIKEWKKLTTLPIPLLETPEQACVSCTCPKVMKSAVIKALSKM